MRAVISQVSHRLVISRMATWVLYDITSSYFEGAYTQSDIVTFGYNRDGKRGHEQMVIALLCSAEGCPVGVEVFAGNTQDASTVPEKIAFERRETISLSSQRCRPRH
jgi:transposase